MKKLNYWAVMDMCIAHIEKIGLAPKMFVSPVFLLNITNDSVDISNGDLKISISSKDLVGCL